MAFYSKYAYLAEDLSKLTVSITISRVSLSQPSPINSWPHLSLNWSIRGPQKHKAIINPNIAPYTDLSRTRNKNTDCLQNWEANAGTFRHRVPNQMQCHL